MADFNVLLVDDEKDYIDTLLKRLTKRNLNIEGVENGKKALDWIRDNPVDVVLLDVRMAGMDGIQVLKKIKKDYPLIEVIMVSGHASMDVAIEGMELGAFDYLMKPVDFDDLLYKLQDANKKKVIQEEKIKGMRKVNEE